MKKFCLIILAVIVGVWFVRIDLQKNMVFAADTFKDCGADIITQTAPKCEITQSKTEKDWFRCACNYQYSCDTTGKVHGSVSVKCPSNTNLVCSNRDDVGSSPVKFYTTDSSDDTHDWFCHIKIGTSTPCQTNQDCEANGICKAGVCEADIGGDVVSGLFGEEISDIRDTIRMFINIALGFLGVITVIFIIYGGLIWMTAAGAEDKVKKGRDTLMWAAIGAVVISIAWTIASYVLQIGKTVG